MKMKINSANNMPWLNMTNGVVRCNKAAGVKLASKFCSAASISAINDDLINTLIVKIRKAKLLIMKIISRLLEGLIIIIIDTPLTTNLVNEFVYIVSLHNQKRV